MGMKKAAPAEQYGTSIADAATKALAAAQIAPPESGATAAINRLKTTKPKDESKAYVGRDFNKEGLQKTKCAQFEAALMSPAIAGMKFDTMDEYLKLVKQAADAGVAYTFGE